MVTVFVMINTDKKEVSIMKRILEVTNFWEVRKRVYNEKHLRTDGLALASKPDNLSLFTRTHRLEGEDNWEVPTSQLSSDLHMHVMACICSQWMNRQTNKWKERDIRARKKENEDAGEERCIRVNRVCKGSKKWNPMIWHTVDSIREEHWGIIFQISFEGPKRTEHLGTEEC